MTPRTPVLATASAAALATALAAVLLGSVPASADAGSSSHTAVDEIDDLSRVERVAEELGRSPLYVHHGASWAWSDEVSERIDGRLGAAPLAELPVYVVVYQPLATDESRGRPTLFLEALHEVSGRDGIYVAMTVDDRIVLESFDGPIRSTEIVVESLDAGDGLAGKTDQVLDLLEEARDGRVGSGGTPRGPDLLHEPPELVSRQSATETSWSALRSLFPAGLVIGLLSATVFAYRGNVRGLARHLTTRGLLFMPRSRTYRAPARPRRWILRPLLASGLRRLRRRIEAAPPGHPELGEARQAYDAAGLIARSPGLPATALVCAIVLGRAGEQILETPGSPPGLPCELNPLHGASACRRSVYANGRQQTWRVCARCGDTSREPRALIVAGPDGSRTTFIGIGDFWTRTTYARDAFARVRDRSEV